MRQRDGKRFEIDLWGVQDDDQARAILEMIAAEWNAIGVSTLTQYAPSEDLWGPLGYQFSDRMTGCLYTWTNANDPDDLFYWHSSQIPVSPGSSGRQSAGVLLPLRLPGGDRRPHRQRRLDPRFRPASGHLWRDPVVAAGGGSGHLPLLGRGIPGRARQRRRLLAERLDTAALERGRLVCRGGVDGQTGKIGGGS